MLPFSRSALVRIAPFAVFMLLLAARGWAETHATARVDARWIYGATVLLVGGLLAAWRRDYGELSWQLRPNARESGVAVAVGLLVFGLWVRLDAPWMQVGAPTATFSPLDGDGRLQWPLIAVRWCGAALVVPVMEELFWRSFLMRWLQGAPFDRVRPGQVGVKAIVLSTVVFMLAHTLWLAAIVAGLAYALLYVRTGKLWLPVIAHAVTNGALGVWVVLTGQWVFW